MSLLRPTFARPKIKRGFTLAEFLIVLTLTVIIVGALAGLSGYTLTRAASSSARATVVFQTQDALSEVSRTVENAVHCQLIPRPGLPSALMCLMPINSVDVDADGIPNSYLPSSTTKRAYERYGAGMRVWYYTSNSTGSFNANGNILWRANTTTDKPPTSADRDLNWTFHPGTNNPRFSLIENFKAIVDADRKMVYLLVRATTLISQDRTPTTGTSAPQVSQTQLERHVFWRNWRR